MPVGIFPSLTASFHFQSVIYHGSIIHNQNTNVKENSHGENKYFGCARQSQLGNREN